MFVRSGGCSVPTRGATSSRSCSCSCSELLRHWGNGSVFVLLTPSFEALFGSGGSDAGETLANPSTFEGVQALRDRLMERLLGDTDAGTPEGKLQVLRSVAFLVVGIAIFSGIFQYLFTWLSRRIALLMVVDLRMRLARHLMSLSMRYHDSRKLGDVLSRISADVNSTLAVLNDAFRNLILEPLLAVASLVMAFLVAPLPTIAMLVGLPTVVIPVALLSKRVRKGSTRSLTKLGASVQVLTQMFQGIRTVKAFRAEERELENFRQINREYVSSSMKMAIPTTRKATLRRTWSLPSGVPASVSPSRRSISRSRSAWTPSKVEGFASVSPASLPPLPKRASKLGVRRTKTERSPMPQEFRTGTRARARGGGPARGDGAAARSYEHPLSWAGDHPRTLPGNPAMGQTCENPGPNSNRDSPCPLDFQPC